MPTLWRYTTSSTQTSRSHWSSSTWWDQQNSCPLTSCMTRTLLCAQMLKQIHLHNYYSWPSASLRTKIQEQNSSTVAVGVPVGFPLIWHVLSLSLSSRTKTSNSTWTTAGTSWACRMSRWVSPGGLLAQPTWSTSTALCLLVSTQEMLLVCPLVVECGQGEVVKFALLTLLFLKNLYFSECIVFKFGLMSPFNRTKNT